MQSQNYHEISRGKRKLARTLKKKQKKCKTKTRGHGGTKVIKKKKPIEAIKAAS